MELRTQHTPPRHGPELYIRRLKANQVIMLWVLSSKLWGTWTHWDGKKSMPCLADPRECHGCKAGWPERWKGFLHTWNTERRQEEFLELTPLAADHLLSQTSDLQTLRGLCFKFCRGKGDKARLRVEFVRKMEVNQTFPQEKTPLETLQSLWGTPQIALGEQPKIELPFADLAS